jgi:hypothetical protein
MTLTELRERVAAATGPDEEIDALVVAMLNNASLRRYPPTDDFGPKSKWQFWSEDGKHFLGNESKFPVPPLTASVDADLALVELLLPGWDVYVRKYASGFAFGWVSCRDNEYQQAHGATPPLAILAALLAALPGENLR